MGADQSKLRSWTRGTLPSRPEEAVSTTSNSFDNEGSNPAANQVPNIEESSPDDRQVDGPSGSISVSTTYPKEEPSNMSLSQYRKLVQSLRSKQGSLGSSESQILEEMQRAGVPDMRPENREQNDAQGDEKYEDNCSSESDSDTSSSTDSTSDTDIPIHVQAEDDDEGLDSSVPPRTKNEFGDDYILEPSIEKINESDLSSLERIGWVHSIVGNVVLVQQDSNATDEPISKSYDVLDSESLLCFEDGSVLGLVYETFGSVKQPMYSIRFRSAEDIDQNVVQEKKPVYFLPASSTYVLTRLIRTKGSDASNVWDEEVADDEVEYSDDEAEAAAKKKNKKGRHAHPASPNPEDLDPSTASLGPLGGSCPSQPARSGRKRASQGQSHPFASGWSEGPKRSRPGPGSHPTANVPHYNPRFADQWFRQTPPGTVYPPAMPAFPVPGYSPNYPSLHDYSGPTYPTYMPSSSAPGYFPPHRRTD
ncbi:unnamed protein product [Malassezia sympodialis ATCC 42132]|uniref:H/ACA ribonucleoprotein complex non-core subunit NAF1 n=1 Tax=Malassezia sympodialis (strain ATCC 42132) TaxID=1230383 RepID=M5E4J7_MALS4|nr:uncharacterized protein MSY001_0306 [Malassezia sympodialis ATCC 42132]CCU97600.1 unnamed protein product [Malassezia sympodialis ATCC 42132]SHO76969.1 Similar to S.cerevisiae protein NAF1 (RNA-binding protein required for the assembly of box H/ACA snoRNPs) [Malassezia sympodialis ATCC 42132]|eukprot:XP_018738948.1 uncharacterized protein MSY001_0306 [Malassezia sympodialis ATCC 42132]